MVSPPVGAFERVDHIDCVSHDLALTRQRYQQLGFTVVGPIAGRDEAQTSTCWIVAPNLYLSCSTFVHREALHPIMQHYMALPGVGAVLWRISDPERAAHELTAAGFDVYPAATGAREVIVQGRPRHYKFLVLPYVPPTGVSTGDFLNLAIQHFTREIPEDVTHLRHANGLREFQRLTSVVSDLDEVAAGLLRLRGAESLRCESGRVDFDAVSLQRRFMSAERYDAEFGTTAGAERPKVVSVVVDSVNDVRRRCEQHDIEHTARPDGGLVVSSAHIAGVALEFSEAAT